MKPIFLKIALLASISLALVLNFSCSSSSSQGVEEIGNASSSSDEEEQIESSSSEVSSSSVEQSSSSKQQSSSSSVAAESSSSEQSSSSEKKSSSSVAASSSSKQQSSSSVAASSSSEKSSSSKEQSSSSATVVASSSSRNQNQACSATRTKTTYKYIPDGTQGQDKERHVLDLTLPTSGNGPFPLVIFLHGGGFSGGSKNDDPGASNQAPSNGYALASIGYRLSGATTFPGSFNDILTAIRYLRANADKYCLDPDRFAVTGFSAGAYHAGMVCVLSGYENHGLDGWSNLYQGESNKVQACATYAALTDMSKLEEHEKANPSVQYMMSNHGASSPESAFLGITGQAIKDLPETPPPNASIRWKANPVNYITANTPPIMMIHATNDNVVPWQQSELLVNKINEKVPGRAVFDKQSSGGHSGFGNRATQVFEFFNKNLK